MRQVETDDVCRMLKKGVFERVMGAEMNAHLDYYDGYDHSGGYRETIVTGVASAGDSTPFAGPRSAAGWRRRTSEAGAH